jgi:hypothetical protein
MIRLWLFALAVLFACVPASRSMEPPQPGPSTGGLPTPPQETAQAPADGGTPEPRALTLTVGGDVTLGYNFEKWFDQELARGRTRDELMAHGFKEIRPLVADDELFLVNLECPFTDRGEKIPKNFNFRGRPELVAALQSGGVDVVTLANNHAMDYGVEGLVDTMATLDAAGIPYFGAGRNLTEARKPRIVAWKGLKVAFLGYFFLGDRNIEPPQVIATDTTPGVAGHYSSVEEMEKMLREDVALAKANADLVIPYFHWGRERFFVPEPYQIQLAHAAIEAGASAVLGSHPHVLQGMELYKSAPVAYSMGNFVFGGNWNPKPKETAMYKARFSSAGYLSSELIPMLSDRFPESPFQPYKLEGEEAARVLLMVADYSRGFAQPLPELPPAPPETIAPPAPPPAKELKRRPRRTRS